MIVKNIYTGKEGFEELKKKYRPVRLIDDYMKTHPTYADNYHYNLETLEVIQVDKMPRLLKGTYEARTNIIRIGKINNTIIHELLHMASSYENVNFGDSTNHHEFDTLSEGLTEYLSACISKRNVDVYIWESFVAMMLTVSDPETIQTYFDGMGEDFIGLFNKKDIYDIILNTYFTRQNVEIETYDDVLDFQKCTRIVLNKLIDIELAKEKDPQKLKFYREIFLEGLSTEDMRLTFKEGKYEEYHNYAKRLIDRKIGK